MHNVIVSNSFHIFIAAKSMQIYWINSTHRWMNYYYDRIDSATHMEQRHNTNPSFDIFFCFLKMNEYIFLFVCKLCVCIHIFCESTESLVRIHQCWNFVSACRNNVPSTRWPTQFQQKLNGLIIFNIWAILSRSIGSIVFCLSFECDCEWSLAKWYKSA